MGRRFRSSSLGGPKPATPAATMAPSSTSSIDLAACRTLVNRFVHDRDADGRTALHRAVIAASSPSSGGQNEEEKLDGLFLLDSLPSRMRDLDEAGGNKQKPSHLHRMMLAADEESGYTPLHSAILRRDFLTLLVLLKHASSPSLDNGMANNNAQMLHPLRLLGGNLVGDSSLGDGQNCYDLMNDLASALDHEGLSPMQLLGRTSAPGLEQCRRSLTWKSLRRMWKRQGSSNSQQQSSTGANVDGGENPQRYRRRMISFGDERDYESLNYDIDAGEQEDAQDRRVRSGSFNVNLDEGHLEDEDDDDNADGGNNDLVPLEDVSFHALAHHGNGVDQHQQQHLAAKPNKMQSQHAGDDFGCEVLTFGRADHCALGVPQFTSGRIRERGDDSFSSSSSTTSYKPKRVETFALGELRRRWSSDPNHELSSAAPIRREKDVVDSPAVAVAASAHHTLVSTRSGQLFSFGLGKGGRLGTGDETHRPLPTRVLGPLTKRIVASIAAAENHSLCSTSDGAVYAWGSNGFGQLGTMSSTGRDNDQSNNSRLSPRRVEGELKQSFVVAVAAGDRHSVALTKLGEVYCWGDNRSGQVGTYTSTLGGGSSSASPASQANGRCCHQPQRVEGLWSAQPRRKAIAIAAAEFSTLVLTMPPTVTSGESSLASLPTNVIYGWGHGNHSPMRVVFPSSISTQRNGNASAYSRSTCINPIAIACAKYHNVAITADGLVYCWGYHTESLGIEKSTVEQRRNAETADSWATATESKQRPRSNSQISSAISSPQLVVGMLPDHGGGKAVAVSASESHTAILTSDGHLFTWGTSHGNDVLGHKGVRWQPSPRKVKRVHRAVAVAVAKEHTALLMGTSFPSLPCRDARTDDDGFHQPLSLQEAAADEISRNVDIFNVIPVALVARRLNCRLLIDFCEEFVSKNLDGVLAVGNKNDFATFLTSRTIVGTTRNDCDGAFNPFLYHLANTKGWMEDGTLLLKQYAGSMPPRAKKSKRLKKPDTRPSPSICKENEATSEAIVESEAKALQRNPVETSIAHDHEEPKAVPRKLFDEPPCDSSQRKAPTPTRAISSKYHCDVCGVSCPDGNSYTLHMNGRKHRNRIMHANAEEEKSVAESMMAMKRMQLMENNGRSKVGDDAGKPSVTKTPGAKSQSAWGTPKAAPSAKTSTAKKDRSQSFQAILNEEKRKSVDTKANSQAKLSPTFAPKPPAVSMNNISGARPHPMKSPPLSSTKKASPITIGGSPLPLSAFMKKRGKPKRDVMDSVGASWGAKSTSNDLASWGARLEPVPHVQFHAKSFSEIQREEQALRSNEDHMCRIDGNQWFIQQRERAASIGEIQEQERLVEEQKMIEEEIMRRVKAEKKAEEKEKHRHGQRKQHGKKRQGRQQKNKKPKSNAKCEKNPAQEGKRD